MCTYESHIGLNVIAAAVGRSAIRPHGEINGIQGNYSLLISVTALSPMLRWLPLLLSQCIIVCHTGTGSNDYHLYILRIASLEDEPYSSQRHQRFIHSGLYI